MEQNSTGGLLTKLKFKFEEEEWEVPLFFSLIKIYIIV